MNFWDKITGNDMSREWKGFEVRAAALPESYHPAWEQIKANLMLHADFSGRNLTPIVDGVLGLLETTATEGLSVDEALGDDIPGFTNALIGDEGPRDYRQKWREQLNRNVARRLAKLEG